MGRKEGKESKRNQREMDSFDVVQFCESETCVCMHFFV